jgi:hypothetical protein
VIWHSAKESGGFDKGVAGGSKDASNVISITAKKWLSARAMKPEEWRVKP